MNCFPLSPYSGPSVEKCGIFLVIIPCIPLLLLFVLPTSSHAIKSLYNFAEEYHCLLAGKLPVFLLNFLVIVETTKVADCNITAVDLVITSVNISPSLVNSEFFGEIVVQSNTFPLIKPRR